MRQPAEVRQRGTRADGNRRANQSDKIARESWAGAFPLSGEMLRRYFYLAFRLQPGVESYRTNKEHCDMSNTPGSIQSPERLRAQAIAALVPFFVDGLTGDEASARLAAEGLLDGYSAVTPKELQLSTQIIALGWAAMACLRAAVAAKNLSIQEVLRLQDHAIALDRASQKATKALNAHRKERTKNPKAMTVENTKWDEGVFQLTINQALAKLTDANTIVEAYMTTLAPIP